MKLYNNIQLNREAHEHIAHGALTNSKRPAALVKGVYPTHMERGYGATLFDVDGKRYTDFICGLGTNLFGYANPAITTAVTRVMMSGGSVFSLGSREEVVFARRIKEVFPFLDLVRFLKTGSEGCSAAVRIARAFTGRKKILSAHYHGWSDQFVSLTPPAIGVNEDPNIDRLTTHYLYDEAKIKDYAAIIIEPVVTEADDLQRAALHQIREACTKSGTLLIFDETITAYRFPEYSVARHFNILPDLWIGGKAIGGGLPLSVVGGRKDVMETDYFVSSTWAGDRLALAAGCAAIDLLHGDFSPETLWVYGEEFLSRFNAISPNVQIEGYPTRGVFKYSSPVYKTLFMQEMCKAGILIGPSWFYNKFLHDEIQNVISIATAVVKKINGGTARIEGEPPASPFAEKVRTNNAD
jgi:glutamate-1-semialdehyde aminotransferase